MDFLEDIEQYQQSMQNAYLIITKEKTLDDIYYDLDNEDIIESFYLPFNPIDSDGRDSATIDLVLEYFEEIEDYEKCAKLLKIKEKCSNKQID